MSVVGVEVKAADEVTRKWRSLKTKYGRGPRLHVLHAWRYAAVRLAWKGDQPFDSHQILFLTHRAVNLNCHFRKTIPGDVLFNIDQYQNPR